MKATINDVAKAAGVSRATVDRVLNKRGNVRDGTVERVYRALYSTNYLLEPDHANAFAGKPYRFDFVLPVDKTRYFERFSAVIRDFSRLFESMRVSVNVHTIEGFEPYLLAKELLEVGKSTDGIAFVALDHPQVREAVNALHDQGVAAISLVSDISAAGRAAYVGIDNRSAGRTAGLLMGRFLDDRKSGKVAVFVGSHSYRGHEEREAGFKSMIRERYRQYSVIDQPEILDDDEKSLETATRLLTDHPDLVSIYNVGGGTLGIARALQQARREKEIVFIAHELNDNTRKLLVDGTIDVIINQDIRQEVYNAVELLLSYKNKNSVPSGIQQPRVEVYLSENIY